MIKIDMFRCFALVATHGSLAKAADALGRTPSAVSMTLKQFEDHIGMPLFETARKSQLTPLGELILAEASRGIEQFENTLSVIEGLSRSELGYLRLAVTPSVATSILPAVISKFVEKFPKVQVDLRDMDSETIARELERGHADIGIGSFPETEGMQRTTLFDDAFGFVCRKDHPLTNSKDPISWHMMKDQKFIANGLCKQITDPDFSDIIARSQMIVPNTTSLLSLVRQGVGTTVLPRLVIVDRLDELTFLPLADANARRTVNLMTGPVKRLTPAAKEFIVLMREMKTGGGLITDS